MATTNSVGVGLSGASGTGSFAGTTSPTFVTPILGTPTSGNLANCTGYVVGNISGLGAGVATFLATPSSANLATAVTDETGSGSLVFATSPTFVTPLLGTPTSGTLTNCTGYPVANIANLGTGVATWLATPSSANLAAAVTGETGSGALVFATSPTLVTPTLGAATATSITFGGSVLQTYTASGSFTPVISSGTPGDLSVSYSSQVGNYIKIGTLVWIFIDLGFTPTYTTATGNLMITGLPFTAAATGHSMTVATTGSNMTWPAGRTAIAAATISGTTQLIVPTMGSAVSSSNIQITAIPTTLAASFILSGVYRTATA